MSGVPRYSKTTLNGNWLEERFAPEQPQQKYTQERYLRNEEEALNGFNASGIPHGLGRLNRIYKWDTAGVIPDDGFREMYTTKATEI
jgi:hypothetical protein